MSGEDCGSMCWIDQSAMEVYCDLDADRDGPHVNQHEGWEW